MTLVADYSPVDRTEWGEISVVLSFIPNCDRDLFFFYDKMLFKEMEEFCIDCVKTVFGSGRVMICRPKLKSNGSPQKQTVNITLREVEEKLPKLKAPVFFISPFAAPLSIYRLKIFMANLDASLPAFSASLAHHNCHPAWLLNPKRKTIRPKYVERTAMQALRNSITGKDNDKVFIEPTGSQFLSKLWQKDHGFVYFPSLTHRNHLALKPKIIPCHLGEEILPLLFRLPTYSIARNAQLETSFLSNYKYGRRPI